MTKLGYSTAAAVVLAIAVLTGCTAHGAPAVPAASPTAVKASPGVVMTVDRALSDIRYATKGVGEVRLRVIEDPRAAAENVPPCRAGGAVLTPEVPSPAEFARVTSRLTGRGWKLDSPVSMEFTALSFGKWDIILGAGPVPKEMAAQAGTSKGGYGVDVSGVCKKISQ
ncbi:hypothetical protein [Streptomyces sp. NPDC055709]